MCAATKAWPLVLPPLVDRFPSLDTRRETSLSFVLGNCLRSWGIRICVAVTLLPRVNPGCATTNISIKALMMVVPAASCLRREPMYSSSGSMVLGGGLGMNTKSSLPGATAETVSETVRRRVVSDVVSENVFAPSFPI